MPGFFDFYRRRVVKIVRPKAAAEPAAASGPAGEPEAGGPLAAIAPVHAGDPVFLARQPIFDRNSTVVGYELLFREGPENRFTSRDVEVASALGIERSAAAFGLASLVGDRIAFVNLSRGALLREFYRMLPADRSVIELLESVQPDHEVLDACMRAKAAGYRLALDDFTNAPNLQPLLAVADMVKVDFRDPSFSRDARAIERLRNRGIHLLAEKVETREEHAEAIAAGYDLFQGYYYCRPELVQTRDLPPTKLAYLRFLSEVSREDASFERLEEVFRQDVGLTTRLLRYLNSAAFGWRYEVSSIEQALMLMGLRPLRKWASMMGLMSLSEDQPRELVVTALSRARFAEEIGPTAGLRQHDLELFLTGMLSVVDAIVGRPIREVLAGLAVPRTVREALTGDSNDLGSVLKLVTAYERGDWAAVEAARSGSPLDDRALSEAYVRSLEWAEATSRA
jgi:EAL and modified HD-GYP domain-containing signal transduction protein